MMLRRHLLTFDCFLYIFETMKRASRKPWGCFATTSSHSIVFYFVFNFWNNEKEAVSCLPPPQIWLFFNFWSNDDRLMLCRQRYLLTFDFLNFFKPPHISFLTFDCFLLYMKQWKGSGTASRKLLCCHRLTFDCFYFWNNEKEVASHPPPPHIWILYFW